MPIALEFAHAPEQALCGSAKGAHPKAACKLDFLSMDGSFLAQLGPLRRTHASSQAAERAGRRGTLGLPRRPNVPVCLAPAGATRKGQGRSRLGAMGCAGAPGGCGSLRPRCRRVILAPRPNQKRGEAGRVDAKLAHVTVRRAFGCFLNAIRICKGGSAWLFAASPRAMGRRRRRMRYCGRGRNLTHHSLSVSTIGRIHGVPRQQHRAGKRAG